MIPNEAPDATNEGVTVPSLCEPMAADNDRRMRPEGTGFQDQVCGRFPILLPAAAAKELS